LGKAYNTRSGLFDSRGIVVPTTAGQLQSANQINRQDFRVSWQDTMDRGGIVVGNEIDITIDVEAILEDA
jgi:polyisoprenoid-binding protein YceI